MPPERAPLCEHSEGDLRRCERLYAGRLPCGFRRHRSNELLDADEDGARAGPYPRGTPGGDCDVNDSRVFPGQEAHFVHGYGPFGDNFDYNCDGKEAWDDDHVCSSSDCCEIWQAAFMNPDFKPPACAASANRIRACYGGIDVTGKLDHATEPRAALPVDGGRTLAHPPMVRAHQLGHLGRVRDYGPTPRYRNRMSCPSHAQPTEERCTQS